jgi:hypothetical protein
MDADERRQTPRSIQPQMNANERGHKIPANEDMGFAICVELCSAVVLFDSRDSLLAQGV